MLKTIKSKVMSTLCAAVMAASIGGCVKRFPDHTGRALKGCEFYFQDPDDAGMSMVYDTCGRVPRVTLCEGDKGDPDRVMVFRERASRGKERYELQTLIDFNNESRSCLRNSALCVEECDDYTSRKAEEDLEDAMERMGFREFRLLYHQMTNW